LVWLAGWVVAIKEWTKLFTGAVPAIKNYVTGTEPANKSTNTVPVNNHFLKGTTLQIVRRIFVVKFDRICPGYGIFKVI
jgi:hypothetical protein